MTVPTMRHVLRETRAPFEIAAGMRLPRTMPVPGPAVPVLLVPGFGVGDRSLIQLDWALRRAGHVTYRSGIRMNVDCTITTVNHLIAKVEAAASASSRRIAMVGHSRGGYLAKIVACERPDLVCAVVALTAPVLDPLAVTPVLRHGIELTALLGRAGLPGFLDRECVRGSCWQWSNEKLARPLPAEVDYTSVYTRTDGLLDWHVCLDPAARQVELRGSHIGFPARRNVQRVVAGELARHDAVATRPAPIS